MLNKKLRREHHIKIMKVLDSMNSDLLQSISCYFGGGTAISLLNDEFRTSVDIDFMCATNEGYASLREIEFDDGITPLFKPGQMPELLREVRADRDGVRAILNVEDTPIKFEIVREVRIPLFTQPSYIPVPTLSRESLFTEKLLANTDRGLDQSGLNKDMIDLIVIQHNWGSIPYDAIAAAKRAYGDGVFKAYNKVFDMLANNPSRLKHCCDQLDILPEYCEIIQNSLKDKNLSTLQMPLTPEGVLTNSSSRMKL